jgi:uncharacterized RDD family membrane protein YckC
MTEEKEPKWISGFWRRIGAFFIDSFVLGLFGLSLGIFFETFFVEIGIWGRLIGFSIALMYFGVMNSAISNGQTLGKRVLKLRVVNSDNNPISLIKSFGRYCFIGIPYFLNGAPFSNDVTSSFWGYIIFFVIFGGSSALIYLYVFNRITRQSLHDLVFNTFVVNIGVEKQNIAKIWTPHYIVISLIFIAAAILPIFTTSLANQEPFPELKNSLDSLLKNPSVRYANISSGKSAFSTLKTGTTETTYVSAQVFLKNDQISNKELAHSLAEDIANTFHESQEKDVIVIDLFYGYDIGITYKNIHLAHRFTPRELIGTGQTPLK